MGQTDPGWELQMPGREVGQVPWGYVVEKINNIPGLFFFVFLPFKGTPPVLLPALAPQGVMAFGGEFSEEVVQVNEVAWALIHYDSYTS